MTRFRMAILTLILLSGAVSLNAQGNSQAALVRALNDNVLQLHAQLQSSGPGAASGLQAQGNALLAERAEALSALIQEDPEQALLLAFDDNVVSTLSAAFPQSASQFESHGIFEGPIEYVILDDHSLGRHRVDIRMDVAGQNYFIHFPEHEPDWLKCNDILQVAGVRVGQQVAAAGGSVTGEVAGAGCTTTGQQNIVAILIQFPGYSLQSSVTPAKVSSILFDTSSSVRSVNTYWQESSHGTASASGVAVGPYTLSQVYSCDDYYNMRAAAIAAADADVDFRQYTRVMIVFPSPGGCSWAGLGTLGCSTLSSPGDGSFTASTSWLLSNYMGDNNNGTKLSTHEGGHNLTLHHASTRAFTDSSTGQPEALGPVGAAGTLNEYGDMFNTMGSWNYGQYNAPHKAMIGWLTGSDYQTVQSNGTFSLVPFELNTGLRALKVQRGTGNNAWLWLEYRQPLGNYDSAINSQVYSGALVHYQDSTTGTRSHLLDMTPGSSGGFNDPAKPAGSGTYVDPYTNLSFSVDSATSSAMGVSIFYGTVPCSAANPTVSITPPNPSGQAGSAIGYTVTVTNNDTSGCDTSSFLLSSSLPAGWGTSLPSSVSVAPGASASVSLSKTAPAGTAAATYSVNAVATRGSNSGTGNANATIVVPPTLSLEVPSGTVPSRGTAAFTALVMSGGSFASGASVNFTISNGGTSYSGSATAGSNGQAEWSYRFKPKDPEGQWTVVADAMWNSMASNFDSGAVNYVTGPVVCTPANPSVSISPSSQTGPDGSNASYSVTVSNNDSSSCAAATFNLSGSMPAEWFSSFSPAALTLNPGQNGTSTMTVTVPAGASGTSSFSATATNASTSSFSGSGNASYTVGTVEPINVSVAVGPGSPFPSRATVPISASVTSASGNVSGASVSFTMVKSDGKTATFTATTDASGTATWNYRLHPKDPSGTYQVTAEATANGASATSNTATFQAQ